MAYSYSTADCLKGALLLAGENQNGTSDYHEFALKAIFEVYLAILSGANEYDVDLGEPWTWARETNPRSIVLLPAHATGTVSLTAGSTTGAFSSAPSISMLNRILKIDNRPTPYRIASHTAGQTAFTIDVAYIEATGAALSYKAVLVRYDLGENILRLVEPFRIYDQDFATDADTLGKIQGIDLNEFRRKYPVIKLGAGVPDTFATVRNSEDSWLVDMNRYLDTDDDKRRVDLDCIAIPEGFIDSTEQVPNIPREYRKVLEYGGAHRIWKEKKDFDEAAYYYRMTQGMLKAMVEAQNKTRLHVGVRVGGITPRPDLLKRQEPSGWQ